MATVSTTSHTFLPDSYFTHFSHVKEYHRCFTRSIETCANNTSGEWHRGWGFTSEFGRVQLAVTTCDIDPCRTNPCGPGGTCIDQVRIFPTLVLTLKLRYIGP